MSEKWVWVNGFEGLYKISNRGNVYGIKSGKMLSRNRKDGDGYVHVALRRDGESYEHRVCRLVADHFILNTDNKPTVNHKDGVKTNDRVDNLEWADRSEQMRHAYQLGLKTMDKGAGHVLSKLTQQQADEIRSKYKPRKHGCGAPALAHQYGVCTNTIQRIVNGLSYV